MTDAPSWTSTPDAASGTRSLFVSASWLAVLSLGVKGVGGVRDLVLAREWGASGEADAYVLAWSIPMLVTSVLASAVPLVLVPRLVRAREQGGPAEVRRVSSTAIRPLLVALSVAAVAVAMGAGALLRLLGPQLSHDAMEAGIAATRIFAPMAITAGVGLIAVSVLNAVHRFALAMLVPVLSSTVGIAAVLVLDPGDVRGLSLLVMVALAIEAVILVVAARPRGLRLRASTVDRPLVRAMSVQMAPLMVAAVVMAAIDIVNLGAASRVRSGGAAELASAPRAPRLMAVLAGTVGAVSLPRLASMSSAPDRLLGEVRRLEPRLLAVGVVCAALLALLARPLADALLNGSAVTDAFIRVIVDVQVLASMQSPRLPAHDLLWPCREHPGPQRSLAPLERRPAGAERARQRAPGAGTGRGRRRAVHDPRHRAVCLRSPPPAGSELRTAPVIESVDGS